MTAMPAADIPPSIDPLPAHPSLNPRVDIGPALYPRMAVERNVPITLSDGTVLFADVTRPADGRGRAVSEPLPTVVTFTCYNKNVVRSAVTALRHTDGIAPLLRRRISATPRGRASWREMARGLGSGAFDVVAENKTLVTRGYVYVTVDVRGTGTSTGNWAVADAQEPRDSVEALAWVRQQPWCNGDLALAGTSYHAITSLQAAGLRPEGLKAVFGVVGTADISKDIQLTGGAQSGFTVLWLLGVSLTKWFPSTRALRRNNLTRTYFRDRAANPVTQWEAMTQALRREAHPENFRDGQLTRRPRVEDIVVPTWLYAGWHDLFGRSAPELFNRLQLPPGAKQIVVDTGFHGSVGAGFGDPEYPQRLDELQCAWFDRWVKGIDNGIDTHAPVTVQQMGTGNWLTRDEFHDPGTTVHRWYLSSDSSGSAAHAIGDGTLRATPDTAAHTYSLPRGSWGAVSHNTAVMSAGATTFLGPQWALDERTAEAAAITFSSDPAKADLLLSGPMNLRLRVSATGTEAFWVVTVSDVAPDGTSAVITRGALRSSRRAVDEQRSLRVDGELISADHPCTAATVLAVTPGQPHELDIDINPTEAVIRAGHRLRVAVSRASWPRFVLTPAVTRMIKGQSILLDPEQPSYLSFLAVDAATPAVPEPKVG